MLSLIFVLVSSFLIPTAHSASPLPASLSTTDPLKPKPQCPAARNSTMNLLQKDDALDLSKVRRTALLQASAQGTEDPHRLPKDNAALALISSFLA